MDKKIIIITIIVLAIIIPLIYQIFLKKEEQSFSLFEVKKGNLFQEVSETGAVKQGEEINLTFKNAGTIEKIYVKKGDTVKAGSFLAELNTNQLEIQLKEAKARLDSAQAQLDKLLAGASPEEIRVAQTAVNNAQIALDNAKKNLEDVKTKAEDSLGQAYEDALNILDDSYLKIYNALNFSDLIQRTYFIYNDQEGFKVRENKDKIAAALNTIDPYVKTAKLNPSNENIDSALSKTKEELDNVFNALTVIRETCEVPFYRNQVSSADKTSLDTHRGYVNTALTNIVNSQQTISSAKLTNEANINTAQASVYSAEGALITAQDNLALKLANPRQEDINLYQSQLKQSQAQVQILESQIQDCILKSPTGGQVTKIYKKVGELVQPVSQDVVVSFLPSAPFEIEVNIYEEDVVRMKNGNPVDIFLVAFPEKNYKGKVISINPTEELIEGVVYYEVTIDFEEVPEAVKPGMTADLVIKTASKEDVLIIPEDAIQKKEDREVVEVFKDGSTEEREIIAGFKGSDDMVEVVSGLKEGEKIILR